ncbi:MAG: hypothetical protein GY707_18820 [Desulfobacteraceae bacterium]|nr:hypothetical protein [Desulfobacteraceae bacterium]
MGKYFTLTLEEKEDGIGIKKIIEMMPITSVPKIPLYVKEEKNLQGKTIPAFNLRSKFKMEETPTFGTELYTEYILGVAKMGGGVKILLNIDKVLNTQELEQLENVA